MTVLVTGATGFIGGALARRLLADGARVRVLVRDPASAGAADLCAAGAEFAHGDLTRPDSLDAAVAEITAIYHAAAHLGDAGPLAPYHDVNVGGTRNLRAAAERAGVERFVHVSSPSALMAPGDGDRLGIDESVAYPDSFVNHYSATKAEAEKVVLHSDSPMVRCVLRPRAVWGPGDRRGPIAILLDRLARGRLPDLDPGRPVWSSLCYIEHCVDASVLALGGPGDIIDGRAYFIADADPVDIWPTIRVLARVFGVGEPGPRLPPQLVSAAAKAAEILWRLPFFADDRTPPVSPYTLALLTRSATYDIGAARRDLGFEPRVTRDAGIAALYDWVESIGGLGALAAAR